MNTTFMSFTRSHRRLVPLIIGSAVLSMSAIAFAAVTFVDYTTHGSTQVTTTQLKLDRPTAVVAGDLMLASIAIKNGSAAIMSSVPSGWTLIERKDNDVSVSLATYRKIAGASEPSDYTWVIDYQTTAEGGITSYRGVDPNSPIDAFASNSGYSSTATTSGITTSADNEMIVAFFAIDEGKSANAGAYFTQPAGMTEKYDVTALPYGPSTAADYVLQPNAGAVSSKSSTISGGNKPRNWVTQQIALRTQGVPTPVAYWKLDGNSNDAVGSNSGSDNNVTYATGNGRINQGGGLDGSTSKIDVGNMLSGSVNLSVAAWVKTSSDGYVVTQRDSTQPMNGQWILAVGGGKVGLFVEGNGFGAGWLYGNTTVSDGNWHHIGVVQNGSSYTFYVDGAPDGTATTGQTTYDGRLTGSIGYDRRDNNNYFNGAIDEVSVWAMSLSAANFTRLFNSGTGVQYPF